MDSDVRRELDEIWKEIKELKSKHNPYIKDNSENQKKVSIKEFLIEKNPSKDYHKTLVICYYLEKYKGMDNFNVKDIEDCFREAKEKVPHNINYKVIQNIQKGYIMESKEKKDKFKAWALTKTGEKFVENGLNKES